MYYDERSEAKISGSLASPVNPRSSSWKTAEKSSIEQTLLRAEVHTSIEQESPIRRHHVLRASHILRQNEARCEYAHS